MREALGEVKGVEGLIRTMSRKKQKREDGQRGDNGKRGGDVGGLKRRQRRVKGSLRRDKDEELE